MSLNLNTIVHKINTDIFEIYQFNGSRYLSNQIIYANDVVIPAITDNGFKFIASYWTSSYSELFIYSRYN